MSNTEYHNENKQSTRKRVLKSTTSNSSEFGSTMKKRPSSKSTSRSKRKEYIKLEVKPSLPNNIPGHQIKNVQLINKS